MLLSYFHKLAQTSFMDAFAIHRMGSSSWANLGTMVYPRKRCGGGASRFFYCAKVSPSERNAGNIDNRHPTLKPLSLCTYLAKLILPPAPIASRLLVPFCGTGSEMAGALKAGWGFCAGIDNGSDPDGRPYIDIARERIPALIK
jgi:hypothetical protein